MFSRCLSSKLSTPTSSTAFFKLTINNNYISNKKFFRSTPPKFADFQERDPSEQFISYGTESMEHHSKPITRAYDSQFYSYFPNLITKKKSSPSYEDWLDKEIKETTEEYEKLRKIYLRDEDVHSVDENIRKFAIEGETIFSGTNTDFSDSVLNKYLPEGWGKRNKIQLDFQLWKTKNIFTRGWIFDIIEDINKQKSLNFLRSNNCQTIIANGPKGVGISTLLSVLAIYGRSNNWITVNVSGNRITSDHGIDPSRVLRFRYDQNRCAIEIMQHTLSTNAEQLSQIPLRTPIPSHLLDEGLSVTKDTSLADVLSYGINNEDSATDIFCYFRRELNLVTEFPVLLIVDDYNTLFNPAYYPDMHSEKYAVQRVAPEKLNLVRCFNDPNATGLLNGVMVCGTTGAEPLVNLKKKHSKLFKPVQYMSFAELRFRYRYLANIGVIPPNFPEESIKFIHQVTSGSFLEFAKYTKYLE